MTNLIYAMTSPIRDHRMECLDVYHKFILVWRFAGVNNNTLFEEFKKYRRISICTISGKILRPVLELFKSANFAQLEGVTFMGFFICSWWIFKTTRRYKTIHFFYLVVFGKNPPTYLFKNHFQYGCQDFVMMVKIPFKCTHTVLMEE